MEITSIELISKLRKCLFGEGDCENCRLFHDSYDSIRTWTFCMTELVLMVLDRFELEVGDNREKKCKERKNPCPDWMYFLFVKSPHENEYRLAGFYDNYEKVKKDKELYEKYGSQAVIMYNEDVNK